MKIAIGSDHRGYKAKRRLLPILQSLGHEVFDAGAPSEDSVDYPDFAFPVALAVSEGRAERGILICGTGIGMCIAANKVPGVRAALCGDPGTAAGARVWNHANVICLSNRTLSGDMAKEILAAWFDTPPGERGADGVARLLEVERRHLRAP